jgi:hypothetical protein|tara:strand:- start:4456 stop:4800 length:345 start_codon:yes stop_codon:yes gene_type:complete
MTDAPTLFDLQPGDDPEMVKKFRIYHAENPAIYRAFTRFTFHAIRAGRDKLGANMVIERIRWESMISGAATDGFKINNNYAPFYSRMFMSDFPENSELFRTRKSVADKQEEIAP